MLCLEEDFQTSSWILQAMKLLRFVGYHKVCEQRYSVITMKVKKLPKNKIFSTTIIKNFMVLRNTSYKLGAISSYLIPSIFNTALLVGGNLFLIWQFLLGKKWKK
jgi:hypothetical protein